MAKNKIDNLYEPSQAEKRLLQSEDAKKSESWENTAFDQVKSNITSHLRREQENACCYCKTDLSEEAGMTTIEHVMCKDSNPVFTFELRNLALCCRNCNSAKGISKTGIREPDYRRYPTAPSAFVIPHPHYDDYFDHILWFAGIAPMVLSPKGAELFLMCQLYRPGLLINNSKIKLALSSDAIDIKIEKLRAAPPHKVLKLIGELLSEIIDSSIDSTE